MNPDSVDTRIRPTVLGTCCIPWRSDGRFDEPLFRATLEHLHQAGMQDLYVFGTAGEGHAVSDIQFREIVTAFVDQMQQLAAVPMVGVINLSLPTIRDRIDFARDLGVRRVQISLPNWGPIRDPEMELFFDETCGAFGDVEFMHYNLARAGRVVQPHEYARLVARHPNLVATKYGAGDPETVVGLMTKVPSMSHFFTELGFYLGVALGPCGLLSSVSSTNPQRAWDYFHAGHLKDWDKLTQLYVELAGLLGEIRDAVGRGRVDGAYDKVIAKIAEPSFPLTLLAPQQGADHSHYERYRGALEDRHPEWLPSPLHRGRAVNDVQNVTDGDPALANSPVE